jgi:hypothetical protein
MKLISDTRRWSSKCSERKEEKKQDYHSLERFKYSMTSRAVTRMEPWNIDNRMFDEWKVGLKLEINVNDAYELQNTSECWSLEWEGGGPSVQKVEANQDQL